MSDIEAAENCFVHTCQPSRTTRVHKVSVDSERQSRLAVMSNTSESGQDGIIIRQHLLNKLLVAGGSKLVIARLFNQSIRRAR